MNKYDYLVINTAEAIKNKDLTFSKAYHLISTKFKEYKHFPEFEHKTFKTSKTLKDFYIDVYEILCD